MKVSNNAREELLVWIGFAVSFAIAFFVMIWGQDRLMVDQVWAIWTIAMSTGFISHGFWHRGRITILGGFLSVVVTLFSLRARLKFNPTNQPTNGDVNGW